MCVSWKTFEMEFKFSKLTWWLGVSEPSVKYMVIFFPTNDSSLLESCQLYIIARYKASNCCKIEAAIHRRSVKKLPLKILQNSQENPCARVSFLKLQIKTLAQVFPCKYCENFKSTFFIEHLPLLPLVKFRIKLWNQQNFSSSYIWLYSTSWTPSTLWQNSCKT